MAFGVYGSESRDRISNPRVGGSSPHGRAMIVEDLRPVLLLFGYATSFLPDVLRRFAHALGLLFWRKLVPDLAHRFYAVGDVFGEGSAPAGD